MKPIIFIAAASMALTAGAAPFSVHKKTPDLDFQYRWPKEATAIPALRWQLTSRMHHDLARYSKLAAEDRRSRGKQDFPFNPYSFSRQLRFGGQTARLISFADERNVFTGGAHGNPSTVPLLWDKQAGKVFKFADLFARSPGSILKTPFCQQLVEQRKKKLGGDGTPGTYWAQCADPLTLSVIPETKGGARRFNTINITASPYEAGTYVEGYYIVLLPVTPALVAALKPEYRSSFEAQRQ